MKKRLLTIIILFLTALCLSACPNSSSLSSTFSIQFIDVGQGDAALVECDGRYMLIDGGDKKVQDEKHRDKVYSVLREKDIQHLDILVLSHLHADHIGGLIKALTYATQIDKTLANTNYADTETFREVKHQLDINKASITVPHVGDKYQLGSAEIEVVDVAVTSENDSLVLMITYGKTRFLFTGDIDDKAQTRISDKYENDKDGTKKIDLIKMPHHGSVSPESAYGPDSLDRFIQTFMPDYAVISVGKKNEYGHPDRETLDLLEKEQAKVYRTDTNGNIIVRSDGKNLFIETDK